MDKMQIAPWWLRRWWILITELLEPTPHLALT